MMAIKNYTTKVPASKTVGEIQAILAKHGASQISIYYGEGGAVLGITFTLNDAYGAHNFRLPSRVDAMKTVLKEQKVKCTDEHAERVAWRNIKDWIDAQIALMETGQAQASEVMMPYMLDDTGKTLYEAFFAPMLPGGDA